MSPELKEFYKAMQHWIVTGIDHTHILVKWSGICSNLHTWLLHKYPDDNRYPFMEELENQFISENLSPKYPFNDHANTYINEGAACRCYENKARLAWIKRWSQHE